MIARIHEGVGVRLDRLTQIDGIATHRHDSELWTPIVRIRQTDRPEQHVEAGADTDDHGQALAEAQALADGMIGKAIEAGADLRRIDYGFGVNPTAVIAIDGLAANPSAAAESTPWLPVVRVRLQDGDEIHLPAGELTADRGQAAKAARQKADEMMRAIGT